MIACVRDADIVDDQIAGYIFQCSIFAHTARGPPDNEPQRTRDLQLLHAGRNLDDIVAERQGVPRLDEQNRRPWERHVGRLGGEIGNRLYGGSMIEQRAVYSAAQLERSDLERDIEFR